MKSRLSLVPLLIFLAVFILLNALYPHATTEIKDGFPIFAAFIAIISSFFTFKKGTSLHNKIDIFVQGASQQIIIHMGFIFLMSTVFAHVLEQVGSIQAVVNLLLYTISDSFVLPGIFIIGSIFSFIIGSSMGTIAACMPIAHALAVKLNINPAMMAATVVCGSIFGDNLSMLSDTTIAAVKITNCNMVDKIKSNIRIALPASILTIIILSYSYSTNDSQLLNLAFHLNSKDILKVTPYLATIVLALYGLDILAVLCIGTIVATCIGLYSSAFTFLDATNFLFTGFYESKGMVAVFILILLLAGLSKIVEHNGGIHYLLKTIQRYASSQRSTKFTIFILVCIVNITVAINTIAILITGPIANKLSKNNIKSSEVATLLDVGSCITQGILPYAPQILLATSMCNISPLSVMPYLYYQYFLLLFLILDILLFTNNTKAGTNR